MKQPTNITKEPIITINGLVNRFGEQVIHDHLDLTIYRGEILGIVGASGSGKSVLLRSILRLHKAQAGSITLMEHDLCATNAKTLQAIRENCGVLFQNGALFSTLTVLENIAVPLRTFTTFSNEVIEKIAYAKLVQAGLQPEAALKLPAELSGGMVKRAALARALALDPYVLFLDEPTAGLDPISASAFDSLILELQRTLGLTVVMITHDLDSLFTLCDRVAVLVDRQAIVGTLPELLQLDHPWIREYFQGPRGRAAMKVAAPPTQHHATT